MKRENRKVVVYTDLDGTLLDETYSYQDVKPSIDQLVSLGASLVFCSSKTRAEIEVYRKDLCNSEPFITENGSAIYIPQTYFNSAYAYTRQAGSYNLIELGTPYPVLREKLATAKRGAEAEIVGFGDMTTEEVAADAGLPLRLAGLAKQRDYDEPFRVVKGSEEAVAAALSSDGLTVTRGGRYLHVMGNTDKGKAATILTELYRAEFSEVLTVGVGDGENDLPLLRIVDTGFLIDKHDGRVATWKKILKHINVVLSEVSL